MQEAEERCNTCGGTAPHRCSRCKSVSYCSRECQTLDWSAHATACIEGFIAVPKEKDRARIAETHRNGVFLYSPEQAEVSKALDSVIQRFASIVDTRAGWHADGTGFFFALGDNLRRIVQLAQVPYASARASLLSELERWNAVNPPPPGLAIAAGPLRRAAIYDRWRANRADRSADSPADQSIQYLQQKEEAFRRLIVACNVLLGPSESLRQRGRNLPVVLAGLSDGERSLYEGLDAWADYEATSVYLNLDWHDVPTPGRGALSGRQTLAPPVAKTRRAKKDEEEQPPVRSLFEWEPVDRVVPHSNVEDDSVVRQRYAVSRARHAWVASLRDTLVDFRSSVIGMVNVKESVGELIQNLLLWEAHTGFLNFGIFGNPGTGKTYLSSKLSEILYRLGYAPVRLRTETGAPVAYTRLTKPDFIAPFQGQSGHLTRLAMLRGLGTFMAIDESYELVSDRSDSYGKEALTQIVNDLDEYKGLSIVAFLGYERKIVRNLFGTNPGLSRRLSYIWRIAPYTAKEMMAIIRREFVEEAGFIRVTVPGANADEERKRQNCEDILEALYQRGVFANINAGAAAAIVEEYRSVYSRAVAAAAPGAARAALTEMRLWFSWSTLQQALLGYAYKSGHELIYFEGVPQSELSSVPDTRGEDTDGENESSTGPRTPVRGAPAAASD